MKVHWRKVRVLGGDGFSLTEWRQFPLAELVAGQEENLPSSYWSCKVETLFVENARHISSFWDL